MLRFRHLERAGSAREVRPEVLTERRERDTILGTTRSGQRTPDRREIELEQVVELEPRPGLAPQPLVLRVAFDQRGALVRAPRQPEVGERLVVDREQRRRGPELGAHVADRRPVGERQAGQAVAGELDERADDAVGAQHLGHDEDEVGRRRALRQLAVEAHADDPRHRQVERLAEQHGLGLDPAHAIPQDAKPIDHRRVRVGADERVGERHAAVLIGALGDDRGQVLQVDLVDDPGPRRHDPQAFERGLRPAQELVALAVALVLALDVEGEGPVVAEHIDLDRVIDDEVRRDERVDLRRIAAEVGNGVSHPGQVHDRRHAGEVLEDHPRRHERDLCIGAATGPPAGENLDVRRAHEAPARMAENILEQNAQRHRRSLEVEAIGQDGQPIVVGKPRSQARPGAEGVVVRHASRSSLSAQTLNGRVPPP